MGLFQRNRTSRPFIIGMIHLDPLPGSPGWSGNISRIRDKALTEAEIYRRAGLDGIIVENMHDVPYLRGRVMPETCASMAIVARAVKDVVGGTAVGCQLLAGANREALGVAVAAELDFIRVEGFAYAHVADEGLLEACAGELLRARAQLGRNDIEILADIKKKHAAHALTGDLSLEDIAEGTEFCRADGLIVTGLCTGRSPEPGALDSVRERTRLPILAGSGITPENLKHFLRADGLIIGSYFKRDGRWTNEVDEERVRTLMAALR